MIINFGKYKGREMTAVPADYLRYMEKCKSADLEVWRAELERRGLPTGRPLRLPVVRLPEWLTDPVFHAMVQAGYRALAMKHHPDHGGDARKMRVLNDAIAVFRGHGK